MICTTSSAIIKAHLCPAVRYLTHAHVFLGADPWCAAYQAVLWHAFTVKYGCFLSQDEEEEEELDEVEEAEDLEDAEEAANRRMDMTSKAVCVEDLSTAGKHKKDIMPTPIQQVVWLHRL